MVASSFATALSRVLSYEGGYSDHPADPGGPTMKGIIQREYDAYRARRGLPKQSVRLISDDEMHDIYRTSYWDACRCDELPPGVDFVVFDGAVNSGPTQSLKWLQRALKVPVDGDIGPVTIEAANACQDKAALIDDICDRRIAMLRSLKTFPVFGKGWLSRVADVRIRGKALAQGAAAPPPPPAKPADEMAKAKISDTSALAALKTPEGIAAAIPVATAAVNAAANPGPMAWALAVVIVIAAAVAGYYFLKLRRAG
ncbi:glycoside hydrolase family 108 protein [Xanthobacter sp. VNH20]|uniref:glycoside hydrolase family 108 protein n=1 Tax=Xanthobacter sp. VNH20 TaxID=3156616 RepID=UPI0032B4B465